MYGSGDGSSTHNVPDLRGVFIRGVDNGAGLDPDVNSRTPRPDSPSTVTVGTYQDDEMESHNHRLGIRVWTVTGYILSSQEDSISSLSTNTTRTTSTWGTSPETRPKNISVRYIIKD
jgi:microcystin-dependent protein